MSELTDAEMRFLQRLSQAGIAYMLYTVGGSILIGVNEIPKLLKDPDAYLAGYHGVSVSQFRIWRDFVEDPHCKAQTIKGKPCSLAPIGASSPDEFIPGVSDFCKVHQEHI